MTLETGNIMPKNLQQTGIIIVVLLVIFTAQCSNDFGFEVPTTPRVRFLIAEPSHIDEGQSAKLRWFVTEGNIGDANIVLEKFSDSLVIIASGLGLEDSIFVSPTETTLYRLIASNSVGFTTDTTRVQVSKQ